MAEILDGNWMAKPKTKMRTFMRLMKVQLTIIEIPADQTSPTIEVIDFGLSFSARL